MSQLRPKGERVGEIAAKAAVQLLFSTGKSFTVDGLREKLREFFRQEVRKLGLEGLIGKRAKSIYEVGTRSGAWIKIKLLHEQEFVIGGYTEPEGTRQFFGSLIVGFYRRNELVFVGRVGTGFSTNLLRNLHSRLKEIERSSCPFVNLPLPRGSKWGQGITASEMRFCHWVEPRLVCEVKFSELTRDERLRQPVFVGLREDKQAKEIVLEKA
jgi:bifunctional non-homologous end joining protein LigD